jgi:hypothetical protein
MQTFIPRATIAILLVAGLSLAAAAEPAPDLDKDGVPDSLDNCTSVANPPPLDCDTDKDGYGNFCDADLNNDGLVDGLDFAGFNECSTSGSDPDGLGCDLNCDGLWNDLSLFKPIYEAGTPPGPSGLACAGKVPCE